MRFYDPSDKIKLFVDASFTGLGAFLVNETRTISRGLSHAHQKLFRRMNLVTHKLSLKLWLRYGAPSLLFGRTGKQTIISSMTSIDWASVRSLEQNHGPSVFSLFNLRLIEESQETEPVDDAAVNHIMFSIDGSIYSLT